MLSLRTRKAADKVGVGQIAIRPKVIDLNLIPLEFRRPLLTRPRVFIFTVTLTAGLVFPQVYQAQVDLSRKTADLRQQLMAANSIHDAETKRIAAQKAEATQLSEQAASLKEQAAQRAARARVGTQVLRRVDLAPRLELLLASATEGLEVTSVKWQEPSLTVEGRAPTLPVVMSYTSKLQESGRFRKLSLRLMDEVTEKGHVDQRVGSQAAASAGATPAPGRPTGASAPSLGLAFVLDIEIAMDVGS